MTNRPTTPPPPQPKPGNSTSDLLNDLGEEMAHVNRQLAGVLESLRTIQCVLLMSFFAGALAGFSIARSVVQVAVIAVFLLLLVGLMQWFSTKRIK